MNLFLRIPEYTFEKKLFLLSSKFTPTLGCIKACPSITTLFPLSNIGSFKIWAIAPIKFKPESNVRLVSESKVITYLIFSIGSPGAAPPYDCICPKFVDTVH